MVDPNASPVVCALSIAVVAACGGGSNRNNGGGRDAGGNDASASDGSGTAVRVVTHSAVAYPQYSVSSCRRTTARSATRSGARSRQTWRAFGTATTRPRRTQAPPRSLASSRCKARHRPVAPCHSRRPLHSRRCRIRATVCRAIRSAARRPGRDPERLARRFEVRALVARCAPHRPVTHPPSPRAGCNRGRMIPMLPV
jgi:hypothetical protein